MIIKHFILGGSEEDLDAERTSEEFDKKIQELENYLLGYTPCSEKDGGDDEEEEEEISSEEEPDDDEPKDILQNLRQQYSQSKQANIYYDGADEDDNLTQYEEDDIEIFLKKYENVVVDATDVDDDINDDGLEQYRADT